MAIDIERVKKAIAFNEQAAELSPSEGKRAKGDEDVVSPGGVSAAANLGITQQEANQIALAFATHVGGNGAVSIRTVREDVKGAALVVGMYWGYITRVAEEQLPTDVRICGCGHAADRHDDPQSSDGHGCRDCICQAYHHLDEGPEGEQERSIRNQVIGYLRGKAMAISDEIPNAPSSAALAELTRDKKAFQTAARALQVEGE